MKIEARGLLSAGRDAAREANKLQLLIRDLEQRLSEPYVFKVFPPYTVAYGLLYTFRQKWEPGEFQVGNLIATIPLAPRESRKIQKRLVIRENRQRKELRKSIKNLINENTTTSAVTSEIAKRAEDINSVNTTAEGSYGNKEMYQVGGQVSAGRNARQLSEETKKSIRESTLKAAQELREERQIEVDSTNETTSETTTSGEISNPNDEISVTYLYYELQRQFQVSEALHKITPIIFIANPFPRPDEIDWDWLIEHEWILRRVILDEAFLPTFELLRKSRDGERLGLNALQSGMAAAVRAVSETRDYIGTQERLRDNASQRLDSAVRALANVQAGQQTEGVVEKLTEWLHGSSAGESKDAAATRREAAQDVFTRIEDSIAAARARLAHLQSAVESTTQEYVQALKNYLDSVQNILALRCHVKQNITYYMQAVWKHEFRDQRYFRLFDKSVPLIPIDVNRVSVATSASGAVTIQLPPAGAPVQRRLDEIADLDNLLGFRGNYMMFPLKVPCHITTEMMSGFLNAELQLVDPDASSTAVSTDELKKAQAELQARIAKNPNAPEAKQYADEIAKLDVVIHAIGNDSGLVKQAETVIINSDMLYIEALPGSNPIMEKFKLAHRLFDAHDVREKVKQSAINNLRMAALLRGGNLVDPHIDSRIVVDSNSPVVAAVGSVATPSSSPSQ